MARNYYCLVAGLREYTLDSERKGFDAMKMRDEIREELVGNDKMLLDLLYTFYDIENIINIRNERSSFNQLGNFTQEQLTEELANPQELPQFIADTITAYKNKGREGADVDDDIDTSVPFETSLWASYYCQCAASDNIFIRQWYCFDNQLRNICTAYTAREQGRPVAEELIGNDDVTYALSRSSAADFGLKNEVSFIDTLLSILSTKDIIEKEHRLDLLKWDYSEELTTFEYFTINKVLSYLTKINIIQRWASLNKEIGREMFDRLLGELTRGELLDKAISEEEKNKNQTI